VIFVSLSAFVAAVRMQSPYG